MNLVLDDLTAASPEAGSACSLENYLVLPDHTMDERIAKARAKLGATTLLLGHHYQRDEVIRFADAT
ncbi:MAG: quinolinate synthase NadA, partial [Terracidiphilus sp.]